jgi:hypothetical protein
MYDRPPPAVSPAQVVLAGFADDYRAISVGPGAAFRTLTSCTTSLTYRHWAGGSRDLRSLRCDHRASAFMSTEPGPRARLCRSPPRWWASALIAGIDVVHVAVEHQTAHRRRRCVRSRFGRSIHTSQPKRAISAWS